MFNSFIQKSELTISFKIAQHVPFKPFGAPLSTKLNCNNLHIYVIETFSIYALLRVHVTRRSDKGNNGNINKIRDNDCL